MISCKKAYIEIMEFPRANKAVITDAVTGEKQEIIVGDTKKALQYEMEDMEKAILEEETDFLYDFGLSRHSDRQNSDPSFSLLFICMCPLYCRTILRT